MDDTGHEDLPNGHPVYGLGGCAVLGRDMERLIDRPWRKLRMRITGSPDTKLHANKLPKIAKVGDIEAVAEFFRSNQFWRFGAILTSKTQLVCEISLMQTMKGVLQARIQKIVDMTLCKEVVIVFESSERVNSLIERNFQQIDFCRGAKPVPSECYFMPKAVGEPALEVADFVIHAIGRQARHNLKNRGSFLPDFCAIFHAVAPDYTSFMEVERVMPQD